ncbi:MAG: DUF4397 domain-containing protein [Deltaproteobacteria bacterium]|nr:DUF4397 domain-containing protein [Deltaproteobacteria bacterium]
MSMLAIAGIGCGDDDGDDTADVDMFTPPVDMGPEVDMFEPEEDMGPEADMFVAPASVNVRIAHLIPDAPAIRLCIGPEGFRGASPPSPTATAAPDGVPFRAVLPYIELPIDGVDVYEARVFAASTIDDGAGNCSLTDDPLLTITVDTSTLTADNYYTVAALGFVTPADYQCPTAVPGVTQPCGDGSAARLTVFEDAAPDSANALIRLLHAIPNAPAIDLCYDPDTSAGDMDPVELYQNIAFGTDTDYDMRDADLTAGSFRIYAHNPAAPDVNCNDGLVVAELPIPTPDAIQAGFATSPTPVVNDSYDTGAVHTIFAEGVSGVDAPDDGFAVFLPLIDLAP